MRYILLFCFFLIVSNADDNSFSKEFEDIKLIQKGIKRDFYINELLKKDVSSEIAYESLSLIDNMNNELFFNFAKKYNHDETFAVAQCMNMSVKDLINTYADCIVLGLDTKKLSRLSAIEFDLIKQKVNNKYPDFSNKLKVVSAAIPFTKLITQKKDDFYDIFLNVNKEFRQKYFNYKLPKRSFEKIFIDKEKFNQFLNISLTDSKLDNLNSSLLEIDDKELNFTSSFLLGLSNIKINNFNQAFIYFNNALLKTSSQYQIDKINFWLYKITKDETYLNNLLNSNELNFYSYNAIEIVKKDIDLGTLLTKIENIDSLRKEYDTNRIALLYSLAKTKSNFDLNMISRDFNVGIFQLKVDLIDSISNLLNLEKENEKIDYFNIDENLKFANIHISNIENRYKNPLLVSIVFDGVKINFEKIELNTLEPYISLELLLKDNLEEKKNFLMYYVLYYNSLTKKSKDKISLQSIFENLMKPIHKLDE
ncbi:hypothetical protein [Arcobacter arenosus]|uniref:Transglycosylase SLT domain-containing protein n=1 Tax=Arcobacter arenosus TaxID=2576037 RepID=A0A5R8XXY8_9BACT|nr:hypothetical protein [Arcobacter arenosus]TLP35831.1 hypothetical protein FDK22_14360 [Arcobacter arenosus]